MLASLLVLAALTPCTTDQLEVSLGPADAGLGHVGRPVRFQNEGARCTLRGYPGVDGITKAGATVVHAARTPRGYLGGSRQGVQTVSLGPGDVASALLEGTEVRPAGVPCPHFRFLRVTPPNETHSVLRRSRWMCGPEIHPVVAGKTGSDL